ncbi:MAG: FtsX-like permease family protein [Promethearchaeota archaeon]
MSVITKIALRNMKRRKVRYILTTITLVISVALFGGVMIVSDSFTVMMLNTIDEQLGTADILIRSANSTDGWFNPAEIQGEIEDIKHVESIAFRISGFNVYVSATDKGDQVDNSTGTGIYGIDYRNIDEQKLGAKPYILESISSGDTIEELLDYTQEITGDRVLVISESLKIELGKDFKVNDSVWILPNEGESLGYNPLDTGTWIEYSVVAIIRDIGEARDFNPSEESSGTSFFSQGPGIFANINNTHELVDGTENHTGEYNLGVVGVDNIYSVSSVAKNIENNLIDLNDEMDWKVKDLKSDSLEMIETTMSSMRTMFTMFGIIALILSIILMMNIFNIIKKEQEYETGMFQAIGASKSETFKMFLTQGIVMGIIGATIGTIFSYFIAYLIFSATLQAIRDIAAQMGGFAISDFEIVLYPTTLIITFIIGLISCIIASLYPSWKASRKPIIECLNPIEEKSKREKKHFWRRLLFFILGGILIFSGVWLMTSSPETRAEIQGPGPSQGIITAMLGPMFILFGIIWLMALCIKPLNRAFVLVFSPYLRKTRLLTEKNILRHRRRTTLTFTMIALTTSFLIGMSVMMDSMRSGVNTTINNFMGADIRVYTFNTPRSFEDGLINQSGVEDVMGVTHQNAQVQINNDWIGRSLLDTAGNESITINVLDTAKIKEHMTAEIVSPSTATLSEIMNDIEMGYKIIIDKEFADDYNVKVGENLSVKFSLGLTYANLTAILDGDDYNIHEDTIILNMSVIAIIRNLRGFSNLNLMGRSQGKAYNMFVSWTTYEEIASKNLPGGGTDMIIRQKPQTGDPLVDAALPNWFNFSKVKNILNTASGIEYYTTRMDYYTYSYNGSKIDNMTSVVGVHTISNGKLKSDSFFGNNSLVERQTGYEGNTMEELLNITTENICVVDETFIKNHPSVKIGDNISISPFPPFPSPPSTWPKFEIVGIIDTPTYYNTEKYNWYAGFETGFDISGNSIYINYDKARNLIYANYKGSNYSNDNITSVLIHCEDPYNITPIKNLLAQNLQSLAGGNWSIVDPKSFTLQYRTNVYDWFAWTEKGVKDEIVLEELVNYIEDRGYLIIFSFTKSFMSSTFRTMLNLIVFITTGLLVLSIIIAMIGLTLHSLLTTMARRREIGMLRSIGLSKKGVIRSISGETLILALLGLFTGIFAGLIQGTLMVDTMPGGGFLTVTWTIPWLTISILVGAVLLTVILSSRYPAKWAANLNIVDAVRTR